MENNYFYEILKSEFENRETFTRDELKHFFLRHEPNLKDSAFGWRIYNLKQKGIISEIKRGVYTLINYVKFEPNIKENLIKINKSLRKHFESLKYCLWDTVWLNDFSLHLQSKSFVILEIEKDFIEYVFFKFKDLGYKVFLKPDREMMRLYVAEVENPIVIKSLLRNSPIRKHMNINIPYLEKIMVDIFCDEETFFMFDKSELLFVYEEIISRYSVKYTRLFNYAKYRGKMNEIKEIVLNLNNKLNLKNII